MDIGSLIQSLPDLLSDSKDIANGGMCAVLGVFATAVYRYLGSKGRTDQKGNEVFAKNLLARCAALEKDNDRLRHEAESKEEFHDKEDAIRRHEAANAKTCFNYLMMLVKRIPDPPPALLGIITDIEAMRSDLIKREDQERLSLEEFERSLKALQADRS